jgi:hypothetical protein
VAYIIVSTGHDVWVVAQKIRAAGGRPVVFKDARGWRVGSHDLTRIPLLINPTRSRMVMS